MKYWRTLCRVVGVDHEHIWTVAPGWHSLLAFSIPPENFKDFRVKPFPGMRFYAEIVLSAIHADELNPTRFEEADNQEVPTLAELTGDGNPAQERALVAIDRFLEYRDRHGYDEGTSRIKAALEIGVGSPK